MSAHLLSHNLDFDIWVEKLLRSNGHFDIIGFQCIRRIFSDTAKNVSPGEKNPVSVSGY